MNEQDPAAIVTIAMLASAADGSQSAAERTQLQALAARAGVADLDAMTRQIASGTLQPGDVAGRLSDAAARQQAYEAAVLVCNADGPANPREQAFLASLRSTLGVGGAEMERAEQSSRALAAASIAGPEVLAGVGRVDSDAALDDAILKQAMLTGALEILPDRLASLAILPLQLRLVYQVGHHYGQELDANQIKDLAGTLGIGAAAQMVEGVVRKLLGGLVSGVLGGMVGGATGLAAGAAVSFASTYALGHVARQYYAQGRKLSTDDLKALFARFQGEAKDLLPKVQGQIQSMASTLKVPDLIDQLRPR